MLDWPYDLEDTLIASRLEVFDKTDADIKKRPKFYFFDTGVLFSGDGGRDLSPKDRARTHRDPLRFLAGGRPVGNSPRDQRPREVSLKVCAAIARVGRP